MSFHVRSDGLVLGPSGRVVRGTRQSRGYLQTTTSGQKKILMHHIVAEALHGFNSSEGTDHGDHTPQNHDNLSANVLGIQGVDVTSSNAHIGLKVRQGRHWNTKKWRDDIDSSNILCPEERVCGQVFGFTDADGHLVRENTGREYETDRITDANGPGWAVVRWDTGKSSTYPIGAETLFSLSIECKSVGRCLGVKNGSWFGSVVRLKRGTDFAPLVWKLP